MGLFLKSKPVGELEYFGQFCATFGQENYKQRDPNQSVEYEEHFALERLGSDVAVTDGRHDGDGEQKSLLETPLTFPSVQLTVVRVFFDSHQHKVNETGQQVTNLI